MFAHLFGLTYYKPKPKGDWDDPSQLTEEDIRKGRAGFEVMASYVKKNVRRGIQLNLGSDVPDLGKACLSEMLLLNSIGIPMNEVINIATVTAQERPASKGKAEPLTPGRRQILLFSRTVHSRTPRPALWKDCNKRRNRLEPGPRKLSLVRSGRDFQAGDGVFDSRLCQLIATG